MALAVRFSGPSAPLCAVNTHLYQCGRPVRGRPHVDLSGVERLPVCALFAINTWFINRGASLGVRASPQNGKSRLRAARALRVPLAWTWQEDRSKAVDHFVAQCVAILATCCRTTGRSISWRHTLLSPVLPKQDNPQRHRP